MKEKDGGESMHGVQTAPSRNRKQSWRSQRREKSHNGQTVWTCLEEGSGMYGKKVAGVGSAQQDA